MTIAFDVCGAPQGAGEGVEKMRKKVLVVEDDFLVRLIVSHYLEGMGWQVEEVSTGKDALEVFADNPELIDAVLTDLQLSDMNGVELARRFEARCPFIFMSGAPGAPADLPGPMLHKPFDEEALRGVLADVFMSSAAGSP